MNFLSNAKGKSRFSYHSTRHKNVEMEVRISVYRCTLCVAALDSMTEFNKDYVYLQYIQPLRCFRGEKSVRKDELSSAFISMGLAKSLCLITYRGSDGV